MNTNDTVNLNELVELPDGHKLKFKLDSTIDTGNKDNYKHTSHFEYEPCNSFKNKLGFT